MSDLQFLKEALEKSKTQYDLAIHSESSLKKSLELSNSVLFQIKQNIENHTIASNFLQSIIETVCESNLRKIETWVNLGLKRIFHDQQVEFKIEKSIKRNVNTYQLTLSKDGISGNRNSYGGGILCVVSLILKLLFLEITKSPKILVLDESLSFLSEKYIESCSSFIKLLIKEFNLNVILVTHQEKFKEFASTIYEAKSINNQTQFICQSYVS